jgi:ComF family protein
MTKMQRLEQFIYPYQCLTCDEMVEAFNRFCPECWAGTKFISDQACDCCSRPMVGEVEHGDICDTCLQDPPPWDRGRSVFRYEENGIRFVSKFKNGDRTHLERPAGRWLADVVKPLIGDDTILVPVPLHWTRAIKRRYNQSILLSRQLSKALNVDHCPDALRRTKASRKLGGLSLELRRQEVVGSIEMRPKHVNKIADRHVLLVGDVMTTGTRLNECTKICLQAGAAHVSIATLAVVAKDT